MDDLIRNLEKEKVLSLEEKVDYEKGQVVSLTITQRPGVGITLFAFDKDEEISSHAAPGDAFVTVLDGAGEFTIDGKPHIVKKGESIIMPVGIPHAVKAIERFKMLLVLVK